MSVLSLVSHPWELSQESAKISKGQIWARDGGRVKIEVPGISRAIGGGTVVVMMIVNDRS